MLAMSQQGKADESGQKPVGTAIGADFPAAPCAIERPAVPVQPFQLASASVASTSIPRLPLPTALPFCAPVVPSVRPSLNDAGLARKRKFSEVAADERSKRFPASVAMSSDDDLSDSDSADENVGTGSAGPAGSSSTVSGRLTGFSTSSASPFGSASSRWMGTAPFKDQQYPARAPSPKRQRLT
jgi:hypothetical protein